MRPAWWKTATVYQVYPRSFADSNGDGVGDLRGVLQRLDYLEWLGIDAIWLCPIYPSPMADFGYDITDYQNIDPLFGTLADFDELIRECRKRQIRLILDLVPNHTSIAHPWFGQAAGCRKSTYRDWYIWRDPKPDGSPPNNWRCVTGGPAWSLDTKSNQYFLHSFLPCQPDLNWRNPEVREAFFNVMRFWLDRDVDGFRIDMLDFLAKDPQCSDEPDANYTFANATKHSNHHDVFEIARQIQSVVAAYPDRVTIGEVNPFMDVPGVVRYYGSGDLINLPFNFGLLRTPWTSENIQDFIQRYESHLPDHAWPNYTLGNHDTPRLASRIPRGELPLAAVLLLTLRGTPFLYYGDELGLENVQIPAEAVRDPWEKVEPGRGRDGERTPMPWTNSEFAGFSGRQPWLPIGFVNRELNVCDLKEDQGSLLHLYRNLIQIRKRRLALVLGTLELVNCGQAGLVAFRRRFDQECLLVALNLGNERADVTTILGEAKADLVFSTQGSRELNGPLRFLRPKEGVILHESPFI
jgi:alpha-glucosidase